jgi:DNA sulfur modification protein DndD
VKIKSIIIENFRQFKGNQTINFDTNGKITVILGDNGTGKTTLAQFFNWVFYGNTNFSSNDLNSKLYNTHLDEELKIGDKFKVSGVVNFNHENREYRLKREIEYKRDYKKSNEITASNSTSLIMKTQVGDWVPKVPVDKEINEILPRALSKYFFFDGERKLSDINTKTGDTPEKAIFSMFNLTPIKKGIDHIGLISQPSTLLGRFSKLKNSSTKNMKISSIESYEKAQKFRSVYEAAKKRYERIKGKRDALESLIEEKNQLIGKAQSIGVLEKTRQKNQENINLIYNKIKDTKKNIGKYLWQSSPYLLISEKIHESKKLIKPKEDDNEIDFVGLNKDLIRDILSKHKCICGNDVKHDEEKHLKHIIDSMPPNSYKSVYNDFCRKYQRYLNRANKTFDDVKREFAKIPTFISEIESLEVENKELIAEMKRVKSVQEYIEQREGLQQKLRSLDSDVGITLSEMNKSEQGFKQYEKIYFTALESEKEKDKYDQYIEILKLTKLYLEADFTKKINESRADLEKNIKDVYNEISSTERKHIKLLQDYSLEVKNDDGSTYKSGGQDVVIMYSYIGGILRTLQQSGLEKEGKEYPLLIDAPFSKVDGEQLGSVIAALSKIAPQVAIMTFDNDRLNTRTRKELFGKVYRITSNPEKTISTIEEGLL